jgi:hypothetical protein
MHIGRIALREQGKWWIAYHAKLDTMAGAVEIARVRRNLVRMDPMLKEAFIRFVKEAFAVACREALGETPEWPKPPQPAPDHEREE